VRQLINNCHAYTRTYVFFSAPTHKENLLLRIDFSVSGSDTPRCPNITLVKNQPLEKANLLKDLEAVAKSRTIKDYLVTRVKMDEMRIWMRNENKKRLSYSKRRLLGVSQSDFVIQKVFIWAKTQKRDLKLNWQPL